jgi:hypothetical protein
MDKQTKLKFELMAAWTGALFVILYPIFWGWIGKAQPPVSYSLSPQQMTDFYMIYRNQIIVGMTIAAIVGGFWCTWTGQLTAVLWRIEGDAPTFTLVQLVGGVLGAWALIFTPIIWMIPSFRADMDPQVVRAFNDFGYLAFNATFIISTIQTVTAGMVGLADKSENPVFPRWVCWIAIVAGLSFFVVAGTPFIKAGPLALEGWFAGWIPASMFFVWCGTSTYYMIKDVKRRQNAM